MVKNLPANARCKRHGFDPWLRKIPLEEGLATHSSILAWKNFMDREAWQRADHRITKSRTGLNRLSKHETLYVILKQSKSKKISKNQKRLPWWHSGKESACQCRRRGFDP